MTKYSVFWLLLLLLLLQAQLKLAQKWRVNGRKLHYPNTNVSFSQRLIYFVSKYSIVYFLYIQYGRLLSRTHVNDTLLPNLITKRIVVPSNIRTEKCIYVHSNKTDGIFSRKDSDVRIRRIQDYCLLTRANLGSKHTHTNWIKKIILCVRKLPGKKTTISSHNKIQFLAAIRCTLDKEQTI